MVSYIYLIFFIKKLFNWCDLDTLCGISHAICLAFNQNSLSTGSEDSFGINVLLESSNERDNTLSLFRAQKAEVESELFSRIRNLEAQLAHGLPPQLNPGEYESLVRDKLNEAVNIRDYQSALNLEVFDLTIMELKVNLKNPLFTLLLTEPDARLAQILSQSPFDERNIRSEIDDFLEDKVKNLSSTRFHFQKLLLEACLRYFIQNVQQDGHLSTVYREFLEHFLGR